METHIAHLALSSPRPHHVQRRLTRLCVAGLLFLASASAWSACAFTDNAGGRVATYNIATLSVPRDAPVGSIIGTVNLSKGSLFSPSGSYGCSDGSLADFRALEPIADDMPLGGGLSVPPGRIIKTNVPGVGVAVFLGGTFADGNNFAYDDSSWWPARAISFRALPAYYSDLAGIRVNVIKIGEIAQGPQAVDSMVGQMVSDGGYPVFALRVLGTVQVTGCTVPAAPGNNIPVAMGDVPQRAFQGPGSGSPAVGFNIVLNSCVAGTYPSVPGNFFEGNFANIQLDAIRGSTVVDADRGILGLSPSARPDEDARGVAVQVLQNDGTTPMTLGMPVQLNRITDGTTLVPLKARYIQTGDGHAPTPGTANAYASFTVTYR